MTKNTDFKEALKECRRVFGQHVFLDFRRWNSLLGIETRWTISDGFSTPMDGPGKDWTLGEAKTFGAAFRKAKLRGVSDARRRA